MNLREEYFACLALRHTPGLGPKSWAALLNSYPSAYAALKDHRNWHELGMASEKAAAAAGQEKWRSKAEEEYREALRLGFGILPWTHGSFPSGLKEIPDPPPYIYYYGNPELLNNPSVAVVGSRNCSELGLEGARQVSRALSASGVTIVSGFARGIDSCAHEMALQEVGSTIAVLGTGLDVEDYPVGSSKLRYEIIEKGLLISEFAPATPPYAGNFPFRNRIISGLSTGVLVAEATVKSGSLITARLAAEQGREVMALPGPLGDESFAGCLKLIKEGAALVETADDVLCTIGYALRDEFGSDEVLPSDSSPLKTAPKVSPDASGNKVSRKVRREVSTADKVKKEINLSGLDPDQRAFVSELKNGLKLHIDELSRRLGWEGGKAGVVALGLEVQGIIVRYPGMYYSI